METGGTGMAGNMLTPDAAGFAQLARTGSVLPVVWEGSSDLETPISLYYKLRDLGAPYLLESAEQDGRFGRYSFIGLRPFAGLEADRAGVSIWHRRDQGRSTTRYDGVRPIDALRQLLADYRPATLPPDLPPFWGGAVGFFSYELVHSLEELPRLQDDGLGWPDAVFVLCEQVVAIDHFRHRLLVIHNARIGEDPAAAYHRAETAIAEIRACLHGPGRGTAGVASLPESGDPLFGFESNMDRESFLAMVERSKAHIRRGDIFQVVVSQRFRRAFGGDPLQVYRVLRASNPSPYMFFLDFGDCQLVGASPEMLVRVQQGVVETRPIAGTRPRGATPEEDAALAEELLADPKERAEHVMLVDLGRNDLGRVSVPGTVRVPAQMVVQRFSAVMHLVSEVTGHLRPGLDALAALAACFPAGTLSGAPKVRAMEIIADFEPSARGVYGGTVAYFGFDGNADAAITIRSVGIRGGWASVQAGGGIVADSVPAREYQESINKAKAAMASVAAALEGGR